MSVAAHRRLRTPVPSRGVVAQDRVLPILVRGVERKMHNALIGIEEWIGQSQSDAGLLVEIRGDLKHQTDEGRDACHKRDSVVYGSRDTVANPAVEFFRRDGFGQSRLYLQQMLFNGRKYICFGGLEQLTPLIIPDSHKTLDH